MPASTSFKAHFYDALGAKREPVSVVLTQDGITVTRANGLLQYWRYGEIRRPQETVTAGLVRLEHGQAAHEVLLFPDESILKAISRKSPSTRFGKRATDHAAISKTVGILALAAAGVVAAIYLYVVPTAGRMIAQRMPPHVEVRLGKAVVDQLAPRDEQCLDYGVAGPIGFILENLSKHVEGGAYQFKAYVANRDQINAFAAPGGSIVVYSGLLNKTRVPEELAAIFAHEITHVIQKHGTHAVLRALTFQTMMSFVLGEIDGAILQLAGHLGDLRYAREDEQSADQGAMLLMERSRLDPRAIASIYQALQQSSPEQPGATSYLSSHPMLRDRVDAAREWASRAGYLPVPLLPNQPWPPKPKSPTACLPPR